MADSIIRQLINMPNLHVLRILSFMEKIFFAIRDGWEKYLSNKTVNSKSKSTYINKKNSPKLDVIVTTMNVKTTYSTSQLHLLEPSRIQMCKLKLDRYELGSSTIFEPWVAMSKNLKIKIDHKQ